MRYLIRRLRWDGVSNTDATARLFSVPHGLDPAYIASYVWDENHYRPQSRAYVGWDETGLHVWMLSLETSLRMEVKQMGGRVCDDSCLEFFLNPAPNKSGVYLNYECSPLPCVFFSMGTERNNRTTLSALPESMLPRSVIVPETGWCISYTLPQSFLREEFGVTLTAGTKMAGNFYKCGDLTVLAHFGSWSPIDPKAFPKPDFHRPEFFREMTLV